MISAQRVIKVSAEQARDWFFSLEAHPERYRFATHDGIEFVEGSFGEVGARVKTRERMAFARMEFLFEVVEVGESWFRLNLIRPSWMKAWAAFSMQELGPDRVELKIEVGSDTKGGQRWLKLPPVSEAVRKQIRGEVDHIKGAMEAEFA